MNPAEIGNIAEARFVSDAIAQGLTPAVPWGGQKGFDVVVLGGRRMRRVQVRSCTRKVMRGPTSLPRFRIELRSADKDRSGRRRLKPGNFDILAVWFPTESRWVFIRRQHVAGKGGLTVRLGVGLARVTDNWSVFRR